MLEGGGHAHQYVTVGRRGEGEEKPTQPRCKGENGILVWITICLERGGGRLGNEDVSSSSLLAEARGSSATVLWRAKRIN